MKLFTVISMAAAKYMDDWTKTSQTLENAVKTGLVCKNIINFQIISVKNNYQKP